MSPPRQTAGPRTVQPEEHDRENDVRRRKEHVVQEYRIRHRNHPPSFALAKTPLSSPGYGSAARSAIPTRGYFGYRSRSPRINANRTSGQGESACIPASGSGWNAVDTTRRTRKGAARHGHEPTIEHVVPQEVRQNRRDGSGHALHLAGAFGLRKRKQRSANGRGGGRRRRPAENGHPRVSRRHDPNHDVRERRRRSLGRRRQRDRLRRRRGGARGLRGKRHEGDRPRRRHGGARLHGRPHPRPGRLGHQALRHIPRRRDHRRRVREDHLRLRRGASRTRGVHGQPVHGERVPAGGRQQPRAEQEAARRDLPRQAHPAFGRLAPLRLGQQQGARDGEHHARHARPARRHHHQRRERRTHRIPHRRRRHRSVRPRRVRAHRRRVRAGHREVPGGRVALRPDRHHEPLRRGRALLLRAGKGRRTQPAHEDPAHHHPRHRSERSGQNGEGPCTLRQRDDIHRHREDVL